MSEFIFKKEASTPFEIKLENVENEKNLLIDEMTEDISNLYNTICENWSKRIGAVAFFEIMYGCLDFWALDICPSIALLIKVKNTGLSRAMELLKEKNKKQYDYFKEKFRE